MRPVPILLLLAGCVHAPAPKPTAAAPTMSQRMDAMTAALEHEDFAGALRGTDEWLATRPDAEKLELIYNCRTWIRWAGGDNKGALAENQKLRQAVAGAEPKLQRGALLHYWRDRSYLEAEAGRADDADKSRAEFERIANTPDDGDSKKVLEAWLLLRRGDAAGARAAASAVDPEKDPDLQDMYVVQAALEAGGDGAKAAAIRERIRKGPRYPMKPVILQQLARDEAATRR